MSHPTSSQIYDDLCKEKDALLETVISLHKECKSIVAEISENTSKQDCTRLQGKLEMYLKNFTTANAILKHGEVEKASLLHPFNICTNTTYLMKVSQFKTSTEFWLQSVNDSQLGAVKELISKKLECGSLVELPQANVGDIVVASTTLHGNIRALVMDCKTSAGLRLLEIDTGHVMNTKQKVFQLDQELLNIHQQAVCCCLSPVCLPQQLCPAMRKSDPLLYEYVEVVQDRLMQGDLHVKFLDVACDSTHQYLRKYSVELSENNSNNNDSVPCSQGKQSLHKYSVDNNIDTVSVPCSQGKQSLRKYSVGMSENINNVIDSVSLPQNHVKQPLHKYSVGLSENNNNIDTDSMLYSQGKQSDNDVMSISSVSSVCQTLALQAGEQLDVIVSYVASPQELYIYPANKKNVNAMDRMHEKMQVFYKMSSVPSCTAAVGDYIAVYSDKDSKWVRGRIHCWANRSSGKEELLHVFLLDFGNTVKVPAELCTNLPECFLRQPAFVQRVTLSQVFSLNYNRTWSPNITAELSKLLQFKISHLTVITSSNTNRAAEVTLSVKLGDQQVNVNTWLVNNNMAAVNLLHVADKQPRDCRAVGREQQNMSGHVGAQQNMSGHVRVQQDMSGHVRAQQDMSGHVRAQQDMSGHVRAQQDMSGHVRGQQDMCLSLQQLHIDNPEKEEHVVVGAYNTLELPGLGCRCYFKLNQLINVNNMFVVFTNQPGDHGSLADLVEYMNNSRHNIQVLTKPPSIKQIVLCKDVKQGLLHRARVVNVRSHVNNNQTFVKVFYVDTGNCEWTELQNLRIIQPKFLHLPFQAVEVNVLDMEAHDTCVLEASEQLSQLVEQRQLSAILVNYNMNGMYGSCSINVVDLMVDGTSVLTLLEPYVKPITKQSAENCITPP